MPDVVDSGKLSIGLAYARLLKQGVEDAVESMPGVTAKDGGPVPEQGRLVGNGLGSMSASSREIVLDLLSRVG